MTPPAFRYLAIKASLTAKMSEALVNAAATRSLTRLGALMPSRATVAAIGKGNLPPLLGGSGSGASAKGVKQDSVHAR